MAEAKMSIMAGCEVKAITLEDIARELCVRKIPYKYLPESAFNCIVYDGIVAQIIAAEYPSSSRFVSRFVSYTAGFQYQRKCLAHLRSSQLDISRRIFSELDIRKMPAEDKKLIKEGGTASAHISSYVPSFDELADFIAEHYGAGL